MMNSWPSGRPNSVAYPRVASMLLLMMAPTSCLIRSRRWLLSIAMALSILAARRLRDAITGITDYNGLTGKFNCSDNDFSSFGITNKSHGDCGTGSGFGYLPYHPGRTGWQLAATSSLYSWQLVITRYLSESEGSPLTHCDTMREHFQINMQYTLFAILFVLYITGMELLFCQKPNLARKFQVRPEIMIIPRWELLHA